MTYLHSCDHLLFRVCFHSFSQCDDGKRLNPRTSKCVCVWVCVCVCLCVCVCAVWCGVVGVQKTHANVEGGDDDDDDDDDEN